MKTFLLLVIAALLAVHIVPRTQAFQDARTLRDGQAVAAQYGLPAPVSVDEAAALVVLGVTRDASALPVAYVVRVAAADAAGADDMAECVAMVGRAMCECGSQGCAP